MKKLLYLKLLNAFLLLRTNLFPSTFCMKKIALAMSTQICMMMVNRRRIHTCQGASHVKPHICFGNFNVPLVGCSSSSKPQSVQKLKLLQQIATCISNAKPPEPATQPANQPVSQQKEKNGEESRCW